MRIVIIDPNVRTPSGMTYTGIGQGPSDLAEGERVIALEIESHVRFDAVVDTLDPGRGLIFLAVDWSSARDW